MSASARHARQVTYVLENECGSILKVKTGLFEQFQVELFQALDLEVGAAREFATRKQGVDVCVVRVDELLFGPNGFDDGQRMRAI